MVFWILYHEHCRLHSTRRIEIFHFFIDLFNEEKQPWNFRRSLNRFFGIQWRAAGNAAGNLQKTFVKQRGTAARGETQGFAESEAHFPELKPTRSDIVF